MENEEIQQACAKVIPVAFISIKKNQNTSGGNTNTFVLIFSKLI